MVPYHELLAQNLSKFTFQTKVKSRLMEILKKKKKNDDYLEITHFINVMY